MAKVRFKEYSQDVLFTMNIDSKIPEDSAVRLVNRIVGELDLTRNIHHTFISICVNN